MLLEIALGVFPSWLWQEIADIASSKDDEVGIKKALEVATRIGFERFTEKHKTIATSLFDEYILENYVAPELAKFLIRIGHPNHEAVISAYRAQFGQATPPDIEVAIYDLFSFVMEAMKEQPKLQNIINQRQIEETNQIAKVVSTNVNNVTDLIEHQRHIYLEDTKLGINQLQVASNSNSVKLDALLARFENISSPQSSGKEINKLLTKQLDLARDKIRSHLFIEAREILDVNKIEVAESDSYTKFRWHTNMATCILSEGKDEAAANEYLIAYDFAPEDEKAQANRIRALLIKQQFDDGLDACDSSIVKFPNSPILWALKMHALLLLNNDAPDKDLPEALLEEEDVLFTLSYVRQKQGRHQESYELAHRCLNKNPTSPEAKRSLLASALTWATVDQVIAHFGQIQEAKMEALQVAINTFEPVENAIETIQPEMASFEVANNIAIAMKLRGDEERSRRIAQRGLQRHPLAEGLLRIRIEELADNKDFTAIHALTDNRIDELPIGVLVILAETYANQGDIAWCETIKNALNTRNITEDVADDLEALLIHALWASGKRLEATEKAKEQLKSRPANILLAINLSKMLRRQGYVPESEKMARHYLTSINESTSVQTVFQIAGLLYDFGLFLEASDLYGRLCNGHGWGYFTQRYLICLVESDQRERARRVLDILPMSARNLSAVRRIEINLASAAGNIPRLLDLLKIELDLKPSDSGIAVGYVGALRLLDRIDELKKFLATDPVFENGRHENEFEFAKYQANYGYASQAIHRLYRLFRAHPQDSRIAGFFLLTWLMSEDTKILPIDDIVIPGSAVQIRYPHETRWIAIEATDLPLIDTWPEVVQPHSVQAKSILGKKIGEKTILDRGFGQVEAEVIHVENILLFVSRKAHEVIAASAGPSGPLWSVDAVEKPLFSRKYRHKKCAGSSRIFHSSYFRHRFIS